MTAGSRSGDAGDCAATTPGTAIPRHRLTANIERSALQVGRMARCYTSIVLSVGSTDCKRPERCGSPASRSGSTRLPAGSRIVPKSLGDPRGTGSRGRPTPVTAGSSRSFARVRKIPWASDFLTSSTVGSRNEVARSHPHAPRRDRSRRQPEPPGATRPSAGSRSARLPKPPTSPNESAAPGGRSADLPEELTDATGRGRCISSRRRCRRKVRIAMAAEKRYLFTHERRTSGDRRHTSDRRIAALPGIDLYQRLEDMRAAVTSDRRRRGRRATDR